MQLKDLYLRRIIYLSSTLMIALKFHYKHKNLKKIQSIGFRISLRKNKMIRFLKQQNNIRIGNLLSYLILNIYKMCEYEKCMCRNNISYII